MAIAKAIAFTGFQNQCQQTGLRHFLFLYRELRCFAVDAIRAFGALELAARYHPHLTHKDASFFDARRIENVRTAEVLMESSNILFPDKVFEVRAGRPRFTHTVDSIPEDFVPGSQDAYERLARIPGAFERLKETVKHALRTLTFEPFEELFTAKAKELSDHRFDAK